MTNTKAQERKVQVSDHAKKSVSGMFTNSTVNDNSFLYPKFTLDEVTLGKVLGKGGFGTVNEIRGFFGKRDMGGSSNRGSKSSRRAPTAKILEAPSPNPALYDESESNQPVLLTDETEMVGEAKESRQFIADHCIRHGGDARYAIKFLSPEVVADEGLFCQGMIDMAIETRFLSDIIHPNICKMRAMATVDPCDEKYFIILDRLYDTLDRRIQRWGKAKRRNSSFVGQKIIDRSGAKSMALYEERLVAAFDLSAAVGYLHKRGIIYRDLKPDNAGFDVRGDIKLFDFGLAKEIHEKDKLADGTYKLTGDTGSPRYMAPEIARGETYNEKCDVYSFAILFWQILSCQTPYEMYVPKSLREKVYREPHRRPLIDEKNWPATMKLVLKKSWSPHIEDRYSMDQITKILKNEITRVRKGDDSGLEHQRRRSTFVFRGNQRV